jgi:hypothetical protein
MEKMYRGAVRQLGDILRFPHRFKILKHSSLFCLQSSRQEKNEEREFSFLFHLTCELCDASHELIRRNVTLKME